MTQKRFPNIFKYDSVDAGFEALTDFFLRWTFNCAPENQKEVDPNVQDLSRRIIYVLMNCAYNRQAHTLTLSQAAPDSFRINNLMTIRQKGGIDLLVEIEYSINQNERRAVLNIENKWYTNIREGQIENYGDYVKGQYGIEWEIINIVTFPDKVKITPDVIERCTKAGYKTIPLYEVLPLTTENPEETGNYMFDEYWFHA